MTENIKLIENIKVKEKVRRSKPEKVIIWVVFAVFVLYSVSLIYPFLWMAMNSLKSKTEFFTDVFALPKDWKFGNFIAALKNTILAGEGTSAREVSLATMFLTSILLTVTVTFLEVFVSCCTAYILAKYTFAGRKILFNIIIFAMVAPIVGSMPVMYAFMRKIHLLDTIPGILFLYVGGTGFSFMILFGHFKNLSWSYAEAAFIDGAGDFTVFFRIMIPLSMPAITAMCVVMAISYWNDFNTPRIYLQSHPTLSVGIDKISKDLKQTGDYPNLFASMIVAIAPIIIFFACFQKSIMKNMTAGGLKG